MEVGCSTPFSVGISSPLEICIKVCACDLLEWTLGACQIASGLVGFVDVWCGTVVASSGKLSDLPLKILHRASIVVACRPGYCRFLFPNLRTASNKFSSIHFVSSMGVLVGISQMLSVQVILASNTYAAGGGGIPGKTSIMLTFCSNILCI